MPDDVGSTRQANWAETSEGQGMMQMEILAIPNISGILDPLRERHSRREWAEMKYLSFWGLFEYSYLIYPSLVVDGQFKQNHYLDMGLP